MSEEVNQVITAICEEQCMLADKVLTDLSPVIAAVSALCMCVSSVSEKTGPFFIWA